MIKETEFRIGNLKVSDLHTHLIGKIAKLHPLAVELEKEYDEIYGTSNQNSTFNTSHFCNVKGRYEMSLMFIDERPIRKGNLTWFCLKEIGVGVMGDWHWFTLNQLIICEE